VKTLHFLDVSTSFGASIPTNQMPKAGDRFWFHDEIYTWKGTGRGVHVGHANVVATMLAPGVGEITGVASLPGGTLSIVGENHFGSRSQTLAVVGGTGVFAGARGEITVRDLGRDVETSTNSDITIRLSA
jgi:hypothetical protein